ncbi:MAG: hypothetical protein D6798_08380 [Deltaproteobacteria bacterium]|nr:MAG: hypothetical protein D6798_08380 [Deltaproteobacteria bacterium]
MIGPGALVSAWLAGCGTAPAPDEPGGPRLSVERAHLVAADGLELTVARATIDDDGRGEGQQVRARLPAPEPGGPPAGGGRSEAQEAPGADAAPPLTIEAPRSEWDMPARSVRFYGGVQARRGPVSLTCDELVVRYAGDDRVEQAVATGTVVVERDQRRATGTRAVLTTADGRIELTGDPVITEGSSTLSGERIVLFLDDERVRCERCRLVVDGDALRPSP